MKNKPLISAKVILLATIAVLFLSACAGQNGNQAGNEAEQETVTAVIGDLSASATASGQVEPLKEASLSVDTPGIVTQVHVREGDVVQTGDVLMRLDPSDLALNVANAEQTFALRQANLNDLLADPESADVASAETAVASAQANLDNLLNGPTAEDIAIAQANVRVSQASLSASSADLGSAQDTIKESQIFAAQAALYTAQQNREPIAEFNEEFPTESNHLQLLEADRAIADAQAKLDELLAGPDTAASQNSVAAAAARLEGTQADLDAALAGATAAQIASAEAQLAQAQATLTDLLDGPSETDIRTAEAELELARIALADAQEQLDKATVIAPFAGVITAVNFSEGELANGIVVELVDNNALEIILSVDEVDVGSFAVGQPAIVTLETWPNETIDSEILAIAPSANSGGSNALVSYDVHVGLGETDLPVLIGMTANAKLITSANEDVLLVPNRAIRADRQANKYFVTVLKVDDSTEEVEVVTGLRDGENTQIISGIDEGTVLVVGAGPTSTFGPGSGDGPGNNGGGPFGG
jgi:HlyD family secretion protein